MTWLYIKRYDKTGYLGNADPVDPLVQGSDIVAAQIFDILRLLLNLRMLKDAGTVQRVTVTDKIFKAAFMRWHLQLPPEGSNMTDSHTAKREDTAP